MEAPGPGRALSVCSAVRVASQAVFCSLVWGRTDWLAAGGLIPRCRGRGGGGGGGGGDDGG